MSYTHILEPGWGGGGDVKRFRCNECGQEGMPKAAIDHEPDCSNQEHTRNP